MKSLVGVLRVMSLGAASGLVSVAALVAPPTAGADVVAYLVNVHVRPGYNFPNADAAIGYGQVTSISKGLVTGCIGFAMSTPVALPEIL